MSEIPVTAEAVQHEPRFLCAVFSQNGDGIDVDACENVIISDCVFDVGDDALCIKSGKDADGWRHATPCQKVLIDKSINLYFS